MSSLYVAIDLETTGLDAKQDQIIEIGAVKFDEHRELGRFGSLVNPRRGIPIQVSQLTGISDRDVVDAPPFAALRERFRRFVGQATVVGHNVGFDLSFLRRQGCLTDNPSIDTLALATILMPNESRYSLGKLVESLGIVFDARHRALDDAVACMLLFRALLERADELPHKTLQEIDRVASKSYWSLHGVFQEAMRRQSRGTVPRRGVSVEEPLLARRIPLEPLTPVDRRTALDVDQLAAMLEQAGAFDRAFPGFEYRPPQVEMLRAVAEAFNQSRHLLVEAGTGVGKSIAYLLPAIHWAVENGERVVVSTNTINLQDQLYTKDIPALCALLPFRVRYTVLKGRTNYLCRRRLSALQARPSLTDKEIEVLAKVLVWLPETQTGDQAELALYGDRARAVWSSISSDAETCRPDRCVHRRQGTCFFYRARQAAESAHLVIVNHALLLSDVAADNRVLPPYGYLVVDEAHHLETATTYQLGYSLTRQSVFGLIRQIGRGEGPRGGFLESLLVRCRGRVPGESMTELEESAALLRENSERLIDGLGALYEELTLFVAQEGGSQGPYDHRLLLSREQRYLPEWEHIEVVWHGLSERMGWAIDELGRLVEMVGDLQEHKIPGHEDLVQDGLMLRGQMETVRQRYESIIFGGQANEITWILTRARTDKVALSAVPLRVDHLVQQHLLWPKEAVILTSATLRTGNSFAFIKDRLGAADAQELAVGSPFDYETQVLLYLPTDIPEPNQPYHQRVMNQALLELALATQGRLLALFTSYHQLRTVSQGIGRTLVQRGITVYSQGQGASRSQLLESFRDTPRAVLLGTRSFWEGVDVPGDPLSCLVLAKLPFAVPSDPVFAARSAEMDDPFYQYAVPDAILRFRQGFGRLIRTKSDRGVAVVMDSRVLSKRYGELFLESLPACTTVRGPLADLPEAAALWLDRGVSLLESERTPVRAVDDGELEYVAFDDL
jgi:DNA polymerase-3 subunit epsilon/ATP-dependent DNA helicase DinG